MSTSTTTLTAADLPGLANEQLTIEEYTSSGEWRQIAYGYGFDVIADLEGEITGNPIGISREIDGEFGTEYQEGIEVDLDGTSYRVWGEVQGLGEAQSKIQMIIDIATQKGFPVDGEVAAVVSETLYADHGTEIAPSPLRDMLEFITEPVRGFWFPEITGMKIELGIVSRDFGEQRVEITPA